MASITVDEAVKEIGELLAATQDRRQMLRKIGKLLQQSTRLRFETERDPDRKRWIPSLRAIREGNRTLTDEGTLRRSISFTSDNNEVNVGTDVPYGKDHQFGRRNLPTRRFLGLSLEDRRKILQLIEQELEFD